jgi:hypothetical protein
LLSKLEHADSKTRLNLAVALWQITGQSELPVAVLAELFDPAKTWSDSYYDEGAVRMLCGATKDPAMRAQVARALGEIGPAAGSVLPALYAARSEGDDELRASANDAIEKITSTSTVTMPKEAP